VLQRCGERGCIGRREGGPGGAREEAVAPFVEAFAAFRDGVRAAGRREAGPAKAELMALCDQVRGLASVMVHRIRGLFESIPSEFERGGGSPEA
jgi:hypothetical protein